jgi:choline kinase
VRVPHARPITEAIVLAAGNGDRFQRTSRESKLLAPVAGTPLLIRTLRAARQAGIAEVHLVLGYDADRVRARADANVPDGLRLHFHMNRRWQQENGLSVLAARAGVDGQPFALLMADHVFDPSVLRRLLRHARRPGESLLGVDRHTRDPRITHEATKVQMRNGFVTAIGKELAPYDALDTGLFVCDSSVFDALNESCANGDSSLSGGIRYLAARGQVRGIDIGDTHWCDIDTVADLELAEQLVERFLPA